MVSSSAKVYVTGRTGPTRTPHQLSLPLVNWMRLILSPIMTSQSYPGGNSGVKRDRRFFLGCWRPGVLQRSGRRPTERRRKARTTGNPEPYPAAPRAGRKRPYHQLVTAKRKTPRSRWSHPGTKETASGKQDANASHASVEEWQTQDIKHDWQCRVSGRKSGTSAPRRGPSERSQTAPETGTGTPEANQPGVREEPGPLSANNGFGFGSEEIGEPLGGAKLERPPLQTLPPPCLLDREKVQSPLPTPRRHQEPTPAARIAGSEQGKRDSDEVWRQRRSKDGAEQGALSVFVYCRDQALSVSVRRAQSVFVCRRERALSVSVYHRDSRIE
ncbi:hypothetical protein NDU88_005195 [Pleurodeles waltl]|uniref:Uncharacterized protein n=1 Tax=Pleurodeles waltl TaxID=8319 RepID=A0AAV7MVK6_PLEWA|nr:hypothetical protein NDU88_005195 [Pleurodeles waltl]